MTEPNQNERIASLLAGDPPSREVLERIPKADRTYRCRLCLTAGIPHQALVDGEACPVCGETTGLAIRCPLDHPCPHDVVERIAYCPLCGEPVCPTCGGHDVMQISRVTGYLQDVAGWNAGKQQELKDRQRYKVV